MKKFAAALMLTMPFILTPATSSAATEQQNKMAACNKDAADQKKTGDARKVFMKECLAAH